jgi:hypothetical protein
MQRILYLIIFYHIANILLTSILCNLYDWQGRYFLQGLTVYILPNILGFIFNSIAGLLLYKTALKFYVIRIALAVTFFLINEICYLIIENEIVLFGLMMNQNSENIIPIDSTQYFFISLSGLVSSIIIFLNTHATEEY